MSKSLHCSYKLAMGKVCEDFVSAISQKKKWSSNIFQGPLEAAEHFL